MNKVLFVSIRGEREVFTNENLTACIDETNKLNKEHKFLSGTYVVECDNGSRMSAFQCEQLQ